MKLYGSLTSPFVRAVRMAAIELGLDGEIEFAATVVRPTQPNRDYGAAVNPLRRVPALETRDGALLFDSRVIIDYLGVLAKGAVVPADPSARIDAFNRHAVTAGATEGLVSAMYEMRLRPEQKRWPEWSEDQIDKAQAALDWSERHAADFARVFDIGTIGLVCLVGYGAFRFPERDFLKGRARLAALMADAARRPSVAQTTPKE